MLATVKSYLGSEGIEPEASWESTPSTPADTGCSTTRTPGAQVLRGIRERFGCEGDQIELRLYTGKITGGRATPPGTRAHPELVGPSGQAVGSGPILLLILPSVASRALELSTVTEYSDNPGPGRHQRASGRAGLLAEPDTAG